MRHLNLFQATPRITSQQELITILTLFPFLTFLAINPALDQPTTILSQTYQHCPFLEHLIYWDDYHLYRDCATTTATAACSSSNRLCVGNHRSVLTMENIALCMIQRAASLDAFEYQGLFNPDDHLALTMLPEFGSFPKLRAIDFSNINGPCTLFLIWVIQHAPHLHSITLHHPAMDSFLIDAMIQLEHVHTLNIKTHNAGSLLPFMKHHVRLGYRSTLRHIQVSTTNTMCNALWFREIANLQNLESFELCIPKRILETFAPFFQQMAQGCKKLKSLKLVADESYAGSSMPTIETSVIEALTSFHHLSRLTLHASIISDVSFGFLAKMDHLRHLELCINRFIDPITMHRLKSAIPNVVIKSRRLQ